jgi:pimeloyl-ACP methyl ester carboxylesterase
MFNSSNFTLFSTITMSAKLSFFTRFKNLFKPAHKRISALTVKLPSTPHITVESSLPATIAAAKMWYDQTDVMSGTTRLHVGRWNVEGATKTALLVHGLTANHVCWKVIAEKLQSEGINVVAVDLRGRGRSDKPRGPYGFEGHLPDIRNVIDGLGLNAPGREKPVFIGHSLGAAIGMYFAWKHPEYISKLVLMDAGAPISPLSQLKAYFVIRKSVSRLDTIFNSREEYIAQMRENPVLKPWHPAIEDFINYDLEDVGEGRVRSSVPLYAIEAEYNTIGSSLSPLTILKNNIFHPISQVKKLLGSRILNFPYNELRMPVLAMGAGNFNVMPGDELLPPSAMEFLKKRIPLCSTVTIPDTNHYTMLFQDAPMRDWSLKEFILG